MNQQTNFIVDVNTQNFQQEVLERSEQVPVLINFCTPDAEPCQQLLELLTRLANEYQGKFVLANIDAMREQGIAQYLGVRGIPALRLLQGGHIHGELNGVVGEAELRNLLAKFTMSATELLQDSLDTLLAEKRFPEAVQLLSNSIQEETQNSGLKVELADVLLRMGNLAEANTVLATLDSDVENIRRPIERLAILQEAEDYPEIAEFDQLPDDVEKQYQKAIKLAAFEDFQSSLELLFVIFSQQRTFKDDIARKKMLQIFDILGKGHPLATAYRRKLFTAMH